MNQVKETLTGLLIGIGVYSVIVEIIGIIFSEDILSYTLGLLVGVVVAVILIIHMTRTLDDALDLPQDDATRYMRKKTVFRIVLMLAALLGAMLIPHVNFFTVLLGLLGMKVGALMAPFFLKRMYPDDFVTKEDAMGPFDDDEEEEDERVVADGNVTGSDERQTE
ncbi:MAG: ATP synthase subunit I [Clostridium sp.]|nr:ATP synthase subunit I [Clostridium sp.]